MIDIRQTTDNQFSVSAFAPIALGTVEEVNGKKYRVVNNSAMVVVTFELVVDKEEPVFINVRKRLTRPTVGVL